MLRLPLKLSTEKMEDGLYKVKKMALHKKYLSWSLARVTYTLSIPKAIFMNGRQLKKNKHKSWDLKAAGTVLQGYKLLEV